ncbi:DUF1801 domain-containing protein [Zobellia roscoffensis]|uniref:DUF1801 domain-containing protein n=1 Tax=Zobellia roscoffensis TaxID=2779508 RepID=UPI00188BF7CA|nr:DUF1801 domain-containing protein [Zobellia roscoffensis]
MNPAENYILDKPEPFRGILLHLQSVIERTIPDVDLKFKYRIPFYYINETPFCYLNQSKNYIDLGFWKGAHLTLHQEHVITAGRTVIRSLRYTSLEAINNSVLIDLLKEAYSVKDEKFYK